jgi:hypothetical protein
MEGWRQWRLGGGEKLCPRKEQRIELTPSGLLMEGHFTQNHGQRHFECNDVTPMIGHK